MSESDNLETRVVHCKKEVYDIYIGRPSHWGNPYSHLDGTLAQYRVKTREEAVLNFEEYLLRKVSMLALLGDLKGKTLGCWCKPRSCHGDILAKLSNMDNFVAYCVKLNTLLDLRNFGLNEFEDKVLDEMDPIWHKMTAEEHKYVKRVSQYLNE